MRILIVNVFFAPQSLGGATVVAEQTATGLRERGHEVFVFTGTPPDGLGPAELVRWDVVGMPVVGVATAIHAEHTTGYSNPATAERFDAVLEVVQPDVIHFHSVQYLGVEMIELANQRGIPTVVTLHDAWFFCERQFMVQADGRWCGQVAIDPNVCDHCIPQPAEHRARQLRSRRLLRAASRVLTPSNSWRDLMVGSGAPADTTFVNGNGIAYPRPGWQRPEWRGPLRFGFVGAKNAAKGFPQLIAAFQQIVRSDYELHAVDPEVNLGNNSLSLRDYPITGLVRIVPGYTQATMDDFFGSIDVLLFPSQWPESYGLTVREAMARGVWPIVSDLGAVAEAVTDGVNGSIVAAGSVDSLAAALVWVLDHREQVMSVPQSTHLPTVAGQVADLERQLLAVVNERATASAGD